MNLNCALCAAPRPQQLIPCTESIHSGLRAATERLREPVHPKGSYSVPAQEPAEPTCPQTTLCVRRTLSELKDRPPGTGTMSATTRSSASAPRTHKHRCISNMTGAVSDSARPQPLGPRDPNTAIALSNQTPLRESGQSGAASFILVHGHESVVVYTKQSAHVRQVDRAHSVL